MDKIEACRSRLLQGQCSRWCYPRCRKVLSLSELVAELHLLFNLTVCPQAASKNREVLDGMWAYINTIPVTVRTLIFLNITEFFNILPGSKVKSSAPNMLKVVKEWLLDPILYWKEWPILLFVNKFMK